MTGSENEFSKITCSNSSFFCTSLGKGRFHPNNLSEYHSSHLSLIRSNPRPSYLMHETYPESARYRSSWNKCLNKADLLHHPHPARKIRVHVSKLLEAVAHCKISEILRHRNFPMLSYPYSNLRKPAG